MIVSREVHLLCNPEPFLVSEDCRVQGESTPLVHRTLILDSIPLVS